MNPLKPIILCSVIYKIISKIIVDKIISLARSAFIPNPWIDENQVIVQEMLHGFNSWKTKPKLMAIKLDLQKACDKVSWKFIQVFLLYLHFNEVFA